MVDEDFGLVIDDHAPLLLRDGTVVTLSRATILEVISEGALDRNGPPWREYIVRHDGATGTIDASAVALMTDFGDRSAGIVRNIYEQKDRWGGVIIIEYHSIVSYADSRILIRPDFFSNESYGRTALYRSFVEQDVNNDSMPEIVAQFDEYGAYWQSSLQVTAGEAWFAWRDGLSRIFSHDRSSVGTIDTTTILRGSAYVLQDADSDGFYEMVVEREARQRHSEYSPDAQDHYYYFTIYNVWNGTTYERADAYPAFGQTTAPGLRLREQPSLDSPIVATMRQATPLVLWDRGTSRESIAGHSEYWYLVGLRSEQTGWAFGGFIEDTAEVDYSNVDDLRLYGTPKRPSEDVSRQGLSSFAW